jgi:alkanesulfonate monooxygenase SsuD/methylene tetrahydromethanopterin reductase-like flavin-dependent oxidoreductase (luciferase family)
MHTSVQAIVVITNDSESAERALGGPMGDRTIAGPVDKIVDDLGRYAEMGFDEFIVLDRTFGATTAERLDGAPQFVAEIASQVADT